MKRKSSHNSHIAQGQSGIQRRQLLKWAAASGVAPWMVPGMIGGSAIGAPNDKKLLFIIAASGGASIVDAFLPVTSSTPGAFSGAYADTLIDQPAGSQIRCVKPIPGIKIQGAIDLGNGYSLATLLSKHKDDMIIVPQECTSVNHIVAAQRAMTGDNIFGGRTLAEACAQQYGAGLLLANCNMANGGYLSNGTHPETALYAKGEPVADPLTFAFGTHGFKGISSAPDGALLEQARKIRNRIEQVSAFGKRYGTQQGITQYIASRQALLSAAESGNFIGKLMLLQQGPQSDLKAFGLESSPDMNLLLSKFANLGTDNFESQAALGFLLAKYGLTVAVTMSPSSVPVFEGANRVINPPLAFDFSHTDHRSTQNAMWSRMGKVIDGLIDLLKTSDYNGDPSQGKMWDRSLIYVATEFGRDKIAGGSSGHHLNNGNLLISPLLKGNKVYGGVDPNTGLTFGANPLSGEPENGKRFREGHLYSLVAQALGIDFRGRIPMDGMVRKT